MGEVEESLVISAKYKFNITHHHNINLASLY